ncbi:ELMO domain-containing protein 1 [Frankliniella fusca]|uniref:ELMO domain-containing protein 1 n=1 Tax=Frankliniella fusca TaxID=407009 RepID=A0AAE1H020_9NEOP|nr:ELMO domain-containing protein 1 [Frankliniella fusca]
MFFNSLYWYAFWFFRPLIKWFLRKTTKLCELQRICYGEPSGASRTLGVEFSLAHSRVPRIQEIVKILNERSESSEFTGKFLRSNIELAVLSVMRVKRINPTIHTQFIKSFGRTVEQIWGYKQLTVEVENLRRTPYDACNSEHEELLIGLWERLNPDIPLEARITKQWQDIGFQGDDPKTDFRGMGLLGLHNLYYFSDYYQKIAQHVLLHSQHPVNGYTFAIVGINLTSLAYHLLQDGAAKTHVFNFVKGSPVMRHFHQLYCYLFCEFDRFWFESKPKSIMDFTRIRDAFEASIRSSLANPQTVFRINMLVDTV